MSGRPWQLPAVRVNMTDLRTMVAAVDPNYRKPPWVYQFGRKDYIDPVEPVSIAIVGLPLPSQPHGAVAITLTSTGGTGQTYFRIEAGSLPGTVALSTAGVFSGAAPKAGSFPIVISCRDDNGNMTFSNATLVLT